MCVCVCVCARACVSVHVCVRRGLKAAFVGLGTRHARSVAHSSSSIMPGAFSIRVPDSSTILPWLSQASAHITGARSSVVAQLGAAVQSATGSSPWSESAFKLRRLLARVPLACWPLSESYCEWS